jgi:hypothetical protein
MVRRRRCGSIHDAGLSNQGGKTPADSSRHPRRRLRPSSDRLSPHQPAILPPDRKLSCSHRRADGAQYLFQRERAGGLSASGSIGLFSEDQNGRADHRRCIYLERRYRATNPHTRRSARQLRGPMRRLYACERLIRASASPTSEIQATCLDGRRTRRSRKGCCAPSPVSMHCCRTIAPRRVGSKSDGERSRIPERTASGGGLGQAETASEPFASIERHYNVQAAQTRRCRDFRA